MRTLARLGVVLLLVSPIALRGQSGSIPTPESVLGFQPGADFKLATYDQVVSYFQKVDAASDRMTMAQAGKTTQGRTFYFALISSKENLSKIDHYREIARRLAHPEGLTDDEAQALAREGKAFVHIDGGLHATEIAGPAADAAAAVRPARARRSAGDERDPRQRDLHAVADDQSRRHADGHGLVHVARRPGEPARTAAADAVPLSGVRRPRQQPRRLHAQHDRVARDGAHVARVGAEHRLRAAPGAAQSVPDLAAAVCRADRARTRRRFRQARST